MKAEKSIQNILAALNYIYEQFDSQKPRLHNEVVLKSSIFTTKFKLPGSFLSVCCVLGLLHRNEAKRPYAYMWLASKPDKNMAINIYYYEKKENLIDDAVEISPDDSSSHNDIQSEAQPPSAKIPDALLEKVNKMIELHKQGYHITIHALPPEPKEVVF